MVAGGKGDLVPYPGPELELPSLAALDSKREEGAPAISDITQASTRSPRRSGLPPPPPPRQRHQG